MSKQELSTSRLEFVELSDIKITDTNPRGKIDEKSLAELVQSIKDKGVIQPILVRPLGDKYELVCGERRVRSSILAGNQAIAANIRNLTDGEAYELQIIENLEREDLHPLEDAKAFQILLDSDKYTIADVAKKVAKSEAYITQRLKLNELIKPLQIDFRKGHFNLSQALLMARAGVRAQKEVHVRAIESWGSSKKNPDYPKTKSLISLLERERVSLKKTVFDFDDATLLPKAGACSTCPKRTKANSMLFPDLQKEDQCLDSVCFNKKTLAKTKNEVKVIVESAKKIFFIKSWGEDVNENILKYLTDHDIKVLKGSDDYSNSKPYNDDDAKKSKAYTLSGSEMGKYSWIYLKGKVKKAETKKAVGDTAGVANDELKTQIANIEVRANRALELDAEKSWKLIRALDRKSFVNNTADLSPRELYALFYALDKNINYLSRQGADEPALKDLKNKKVTQKVLNKAFRQFISGQLNDGTSHKASKTTNVLFNVLNDYYSDDIKKIIDEQNEIAKLRIERKDLRVSVLNKKMIKDKVAKVVEEKKPKDKAKKAIKKIVEDSGVPKENVPF